MQLGASKHEVAGLTWDQVGERLAAGSAAILPIGAGAKQHGLHMPMATDQLFAEYFSRALAERIDALIWPTLTYGFYPAFVAYAGSVSLSRKPFAVTVREIADALLGSGAKAGADPRHRAQHHRSVEASIRGCRDPSLVRHLKAFAGPRFANTVQALKQQPYGSHADEMETSLMLAIAPELVDIARPMPSPYRETAPLPGPLSPDDSYSPNYSPSGSFGDPTLASAEKGKRLLAAILEDLMEMAA